MESHPIPQQISSYQFRLVGDMTLKQFFQIGGGALIALLIYATGLHPLIKWPLILISFGLGAAIAFLPFEERPLNKWIFSFFRSVYSPTVFIWEKAQSPEIFFQEEAEYPKEKDVIAPHGEVALNEYLQEAPGEKEGPFSKFEGIEKSFLEKFGGLFALPTKPVGETTPPLPAQPPKPVPLSVPEDKPIEIAVKGFRPKIVVEEKPIVEEVITQQVTPTVVSPTLQGVEIKSQAAQFSQQAALPFPPTIPNTITGQVVDANGKIIEGVILEIRDLAGRPVRALRSNKVGHFIIVTALANGQYDLIADKTGFDFDPVTFEAKGEIIPPILIRSKAPTVAATTNQTAIN